MEEKEILLKLSPKYNFIYELGMPTGRKVKNSLLTVLLAIIIYIIGIIGINYIDTASKFDKGTITNVFSIVILIMGIFFLIKAIVHVVFQKLQYKNLTYTFYNDSLEYKDMFWNQQTKIIRYENIKEIEIRKNIWERLNNRGIIILYTSAEKAKGKGMIIYSITNVEDTYNKIQEIIDKSRIINKQETVEEPKKEEIKVENTVSPEEEFKNKLRNM